MLVLEVAPQFQYGPDSLSGIYVASSSGQQVPLKTLTNQETKAAPIVVNHQGMFPAATISFNLQGGASLGPALHPPTRSCRSTTRPWPMVRETGTVSMSAGIWFRKWLA